VRWRWVNASHWQHPMHLHGFHYRTLARGDGRQETVFPPEKVQEVVTELMEPGSTFRMEWTATRRGNWLMHCHIVNHVVPDPERDAAERMHELHDVTLHPFEAMAGMVMGPTSPAASPAPKSGSRSSTAITTPRCSAPRSASAPERSPSARPDPATTAS
jgi:hypothetical protein